jgi:hypothetical protein
MASIQGFAKPRPLERAAEVGVSVGLAASAILGFLAMVASATYQGRGFFTPMYHAAFVVDPHTMGAAIDKAGAGEPFYFAKEAFIFGLIIYVLMGGALGAIFAMVAKALHLHGPRAIAGGLVYGLAVMALMSLVVLPQVAAMSGAGKPISHMADEVGWPTFVAQFALFGLLLGSWLYFRPQDIGEAPRSVPH